MIFSRTGRWNLNDKILFILATILGLASTLDISYCSSQNTGSETGPFPFQFQSDGHCQDTCKYQYAYAILQSNNCWCSNYAPFDQVDVGQCNDDCPGFPSDKCGNKAEGLFGYYHLTIQPSGTVGAPASPSTQTSSPSPAAPTTATITATVLATVTNTPSPTTSSITSSSTSSPPITPTTATSVKTTWIPTPITIITTVEGSKQTVTVTPSVPPSAGETAVAPAQDSDPFWSNTAKVAGTFTVVAVVIVLLLLGVGFFCWRRFRSSDSVAIRSVSDHDGQSTHGAFFGGMTERRHSRLGLNTAGGILGRRGSHDRSPPSATPASMSRRASQPMVHDQRLNPNALYAMGPDHGSRVSLESFQDDRDYSRPVLHVRNPDT